MGCKASVIVPVYNAAKTLRRCVESVVLGLERNIEVILVEDCSQDSSWDLCCQLADEFSQVTCIRNRQNSGVSFTRNQGLSLAHGKYILFVDSDDWVSQYYAKDLLSLADDNPEALALCGHHFIDYTANSKRDYLWDSAQGTRVPVLPDSFFALADRFLLQQLWNKIFRRDIIKSSNIRFDESQSMGEDFQFVLDYMEAMQCKQCVILNKPLYYYIRWNHTSLMSKFGLTQRQQEYNRFHQLHKITGLSSTEQRDAMILQAKQNYIYHIVRNTALSKSEKLDAIEHIINDGKNTEYYHQQLKIYTKEQIIQILLRVKQLLPRLNGRIQRQLQEKRIASIRKKLRANHFSIISQNCIAGVFYHDMGLPFLSPTINTFIKEPDFVRMVRNLQYYMDRELVMRWEEEYPVGILDDIEIHFMHYSTCQEAAAAWMRRKERIQYDKILILATDRDGFDEAVYAQWCQISYPKLLFTANPNFTEDTIVFPEFSVDGVVGDLISDRKLYWNNILIGKLNSST